MCIYVVLIKGRRRTFTRQRVIFLIVAVALFTFATLDVALLLRHVLDAFIWYHGPGGAIGEFKDISYWVNVMKTVTYNAQTSIADGMLVCITAAKLFYFTEMLSLSADLQMLYCVWT